MFDNIGGKIKNLATVICVIGIIASVILAIALWSQNERYNPTVALGFGVLIGGCVGSWVGSFFMYGFGQLIEDTSAIRDLLSRQGKSETVQMEASVMKQKTENMPTVQAMPVGMFKTEIAGWTCPKCKFFNASSKDVCSLCGETK